MSLEEKSILTAGSEPGRDPRRKHTLSHKHFVLYFREGRLFFDAIERCRHWSRPGRPTRTKAIAILIELEKCK